MTSKSRKENDPEESGAQLPDETNVPSTEPAEAANDTSAETSSHLESDEVSLDDLLDDVRHTLIEEEQAHEKEGETTWWQRIRKGGRKNNAEQEAPKVVEEINLPRLDVEQKAAEPELKVDVDEEPDPIDELIDMLESEESEAQKPVVVQEPIEEPEKRIDLEELKRQAFQPRPVASPEETLTEVRSIALEGDEEVFVEVQTTPEDPLEERLKAVENAFKPYRRYINFGLAFLGLVMAVIAGLVLFNIYKQTVVAPATQAAISNLPFPTSVSLPGGWTFDLGRGSLVDGNWNPGGAEWLQGTEVCRWVALPWSRQLEAVIRTLNPDDPIDLGMSNNDVLTYKVASIEQMSPAQMQELDSNRPCLLIVLAEPDTEERWVLTALP